MSKKMRIIKKYCNHEVILNDKLRQYKNQIMLYQAVINELKLHVDSDIVEDAFTKSKTTLKEQGKFKKASPEAKRKIKEVLDEQRRVYDNLRASDELRNVSPSVARKMLEAKPKIEAILNGKETMNYMELGEAL